MGHEIEYDEAMTTMLELIWGEGFMAPGGEGNVANLIDGLEVQNKRILDIGCGLGGPAFVLAKTYGATVVVCQKGEMFQVYCRGRKPF